MAEARTARLVHATGDSQARYLTFETEESRPLDFIGGQYIIVNTGIFLSGGKLVKRAYSVVSQDSDQHRFQLAVKCIGSGPGSNFMHKLFVGANLTFSGPWGKFYPDENEGGSPMLVFATDTGITAALGLLRSRRVRSSSARIRVIWFVEDWSHFTIDPRMESERDFAWTMSSPSSARWPLCESTAGLSALRDIATISSGLAVHHPERPTVALELLRKACIDFTPQRAFLSGDGAILFPLADQLKIMGLPETAIRMECFFNNPNRKAP